MRKTEATASLPARGVGSIITTDNGGHFHRIWENVHMNVKQAALGLGVIVAAGMIQACFDEANSSDADLLARIEALEAQQHRVITASAGASQAKALDAGLESIGTLLSFDNVPSTATVVNVRSSLGYVFTVGLSDGALRGPGGATGGAVFFLTADCSGQAFADPGAASEYGARQGVVFRIERDGTDIYYAVLAGTQLAPATYGSIYAAGGGCTAQDFVTSLYPLTINDPQVTGVANSPVASITVG